MEKVKRESILGQFFSTIINIITVKENKNINSEIPEFSDLSEKDFEEEEVSKDVRRTLEKSLSNLPNEVEKQRTQVGRQKVDTKKALEKLSNQEQGDSNAKEQKKDEYEHEL